MSEGAEARMPIGGEDERSADAWPSQRSEALASWFSREVAGFEGPLVLEKFAGGQSNPTYLVHARSGRYVLRRRPAGLLLPSAHAIDREYRILEALHPTDVPVPEPLAFCDDPQVAGSSFYVMRMVDGRSLWDGTLPDMPAASRHAHYEAMIDTLVALHSVEPSRVGLDGFGPEGHYFSRQITRWTRQYRASQTDEISAMEELIEWLPHGMPPQSRTAIVHGDYRIDNLIFASGRPQVTAVLDWELATLGDPHADVMNLAMNWIMPADGRSGLAGVDLEKTSLPTMSAMLARYAGATGHGDLPDPHWYFAFGLFRLASIIQGVKKRLLEGNASSHAAHATVTRMKPLTELALEQARRAGKK